MIAEIISQEFEVSVTEALEDIQEYLGQLVKADLVVKAEPEASSEAKLCLPGEDR
jgi:hypothetical protein